MHEVTQQLGVVVEHLFEVGHDPALVDAVAMEATGEMVVDAAAARHLLERDGKGHGSFAVVAIHGHFKQEVESGGVREFGLGAESAIARIEEFERCGDDLSTRSRERSPPRRRSSRFARWPP